MEDFWTLPLCKVLVTALWPAEAVGLGAPGRDGYMQVCRADSGDRIIHVKNDWFVCLCDVCCFWKRWQMWDLVSVQSSSLLSGYCFAGLGRASCLLTVLHHWKDSLHYRVLLYSGHVWNSPNRREQLPYKLSPSAEFIFPKQSPLREHQGFFKSQMT